MLGRKAASAASTMEQAALHTAHSAEADDGGAFLSTASEPAHVQKVCSQIDVMPTLFNLLGFSYDSRFYGQDVLSDDFRERAFMATYQDLGYYADSVLTVLSPVRQVRQFAVEQTGRSNFTETLIEDEVAEKQLRETQAVYQVINTEYQASSRH